MTVPAVRVARDIRHTTDALPLPQPPRAGALPRLDAALAARRDGLISDAALTTATAAILYLPTGQWSSTDDLAAASGLTERQARAAVSELVKAGLFTRSRMAVDAPSGRAARYRYAVAVTR